MEASTHLQFIGNQRALAAVGRLLASPNRPHAYLLSGPQHVGKATLARHIAQALNCEGEEPPCGACAPCTRIVAGIHSDVQTVTVEASEEGAQRKVIGVQQVRELQQSASLNPFEGRTRVIIIDPADQMSTGAQNAFLKPLEEPPPNVAFVLVTANETALAETVRSRCQRIELALVPAAEIESALAARGVESGRAAVLARLACGRPGWALGIAADPGAMEKRREALLQARGLAGTPVPDRLRLAEKLAEDWRNSHDAVFDRLTEWQSWWRDVLLAAAGAEDAISNVDLAAELREDAGSYGRADITRFLQALTEAQQHLRENVQARLVLDALLLHAPAAVRQARAAR